MNSLFERFLPVKNWRNNILPPLTLVIWMASKFPEDFSLNTASTAMLLKKSLWVVKILELKVVLAMLSKSSLNFTSSSPWSLACDSKASRATFVAILQPATIFWGWILCSINFSASRRSSEAKTTTEVVPSPTWNKNYSFYLLPCSCTHLALWRAR